jgi:hypothetical protein
MQRELKIGEKTFIVRELLAIELDDINFDDKKESIKKQVMLSTGLSEEQYKNLTIKERFAIVNTINEINGFSQAN